MIAGNYFFNNMTNINEDSCSIAQNGILNSKASNYMVENFYPACPMSKAIDFATKQPSVFYNGSYQVGINGCNIDTSSTLLKSNEPRAACRINLLERPFLTVPYLGKGPYNCNVECDLIQGNLNTNRKSVNPTSEYSYSNYTNYPLIPQIQKTLANPNNCIESVASAGWIRGGLPSRDMSKDSSDN